MVKLLGLVPVQPVHIGLLDLHIGALQPLYRPVELHLVPPVVKPPQVLVGQIECPCHLAPQKLQNCTFLVRTHNLLGHLPECPLDVEPDGHLPWRLPCRPRLVQRQNMSCASANRNHPCSATAAVINIFVPNDVILIELVLVFFRFFPLVSK